jgi:hypothetical protein
VEWTDVQQRLLDSYGIRVEPQMASYVMRRLTEPASAPPRELPVIGGNARTGMPLRISVDPAVLMKPASPQVS